MEPEGVGESLDKLQFPRIETNEEAQIRKRDRLLEIYGSFSDEEKNPFGFAEFARNEYRELAHETHEFLNGECSAEELRGKREKVSQDIEALSLLTDPPTDLEIKGISSIFKLDFDQLLDSQKDLAEISESVTQAHSGRKKEKLKKRLLSVGRKSHSVFRRIQEQKINSGRRVEIKLEETSDHAGKEPLPEISEDRMPEKGVIKPLSPTTKERLEQIETKRGDEIIKQNLEAIPVVMEVDRARNRVKDWEKEKRKYKLKVIGYHQAPRFVPDMPTPPDEDEYREALDELKVDLDEINNYMDRILPTDLEVDARVYQTYRRNRGVRGEVDEMLKEEDLGLDKRAKVVKRYEKATRRRWRAFRDMESLRKGLLPIDREGELTSEQKGLMRDIRESELGEKRQEYLDRKREYKESVGLTSAIKRRHFGKAMDNYWSALKKENSLLGEEIAKLYRQSEKNGREVLLSGLARPNVRLYELIREISDSKGQNKPELIEEFAKELEEKRKVLLEVGTTKKTEEQTTVPPETERSPISQEGSVQGQVAEDKEPVAQPAEQAEIVSEVTPENANNWITVEGDELNPGDVREGAKYCRPATTEYLGTFLYTYYPDGRLIREYVDSRFNPIEPPDPKYATKTWHLTEQQAIDNLIGIFGHESEKWGERFRILPLSLPKETAQEPAEHITESKELAAAEPVNLMESAVPAEVSSTTAELPPEETSVVEVEQPREEEQLETEVQLTGDPLWDRVRQARNEEEDLERQLEKARTSIPNRLERIRKERKLKDKLEKAKKEHREAMRAVSRRASGGELAKHKETEGQPTGETVEEQGPEAAAAKELPEPVVEPHEAKRELSGLLKKVVGPITEVREKQRLRSELWREYEAAWNALQKADRKDPQYAEVEERYKKATRDWYQAQSGKGP